MPTRYGSTPFVGEYTRCGAQQAFKEAAYSKRKAQQTHSSRKNPYNPPFPFVPCLTIEFAEFALLRDVAETLV